MLWLDLLRQWLTNARPKQPEPPATYFYSVTAIDEPPKIRTVSCSSVSGITLPATGTTPGQQTVIENRTGKPLVAHGRTLQDGEEITLVATDTGWKVN